MASLKDVAQLAGVSMMTVSRVINQTGAVSDATRERVMQAVEALNYVPDLSARRVRNPGLPPLDPRRAGAGHRHYALLGRDAAGD